MSSALRGIEKRFWNFQSSRPNFRRSEILNFLEVFGMIELQNTGSLFHLPHDEREAAVVTTNGMLCKNGDAVMGKGQALPKARLGLWPPAA